MTPTFTFSPQFPVVASSLRSPDSNKTHWIKDTRYKGSNVAVKDTKDMKDECGAIVAKRYQRGRVHIVTGRKYGKSSTEKGGEKDEG